MAVWIRILQYQFHCPIHILYTLDKGCIREMWCQLLATSSHLQLQWIFVFPEGVFFWINLEAIRPVKSKVIFQTNMFCGEPGSTLTSVAPTMTPDWAWRLLPPRWTPQLRWQAPRRWTDLFWWVLREDVTCVEGVWIRFVFWDLYCKCLW